MPAPYTFRFGTIAHELGHNVGMKHLWENTGGTQGDTNYIMDYGHYGEWKFHPESIEDYNNRKAWLTCNKPIHSSRDEIYFIKAVATGRYLFADGSNVRSSRDAEAGWVVAPRVRAVDANYYNLAKWKLIHQGNDIYVIENVETGRYLLGQGSSVVGNPYASEGGWRHAPRMVASDAGYYNLHRWQLLRHGSIYFFQNVRTGRYLMGQGSSVIGRQRGFEGYTGAPQVVAADANYYNLAEWSLYKTTL